MAAAKGTASGNGASDTSDIAAQLESVKADLASLSEAVSDYARGKGDEARDRLQARAEEVKSARAAHGRKRPRRGRASGFAGDGLRP